MGSHHSLKLLGLFDLVLSLKPEQFYKNLKRMESIPHTQKILIIITRASLAVNASLFCFVIVVDVVVFFVFDYSLSTQGDLKCFCTSNIKAPVGQDEVKINSPTQCVRVGMGEWWSVNAFALIHDRNLSLSISLS